MELQSRVYVTMMMDSIKKKEDILVSLLEQTVNQGKLLEMDRMDADEFNRLIDEKERLIVQLNEIDCGFQKLFTAVKSELEKNKDDYRKEIQQMQGMIGDLSDLSVEIQTQENRNSEKMKRFLLKEKDIIRNYHINNRTAATYYQNMANVHRRDKSYFLNEKK